MAINNFILLSPLGQFEVFNMFGIISPILESFNLNLSITNLSLYLIILFSIVIGLHLYGDNESYLIPNKFSIAFETSFASLITLVREQISKTKETYFPFIYSLFFFILIGNLIGNVPYSFAITTSAVVCLGFSVTIFLAVTILAVKKHLIKFFSYFIPSGTPLGLVPLLVLIELVSYLARSLSLGVRLFSNLVSGHTLMNILSTFIFKLFSTSLLIGVLTLIPFALFIAITGLELAVSFIQSYVFTLLTCSYLKDAIYLH